jgi:hypothetical protein
MIERQFEHRGRRAAALVMLLLWSASAAAQRGVGELRLHVTDTTGSPMDVGGTLASDATHVLQTFTTGTSGAYIAKNLPFGIYTLRLERTGFTLFTTLIDVRSEVPLAYPVTLAVAPLQTAVTVTASEGRTLLDPYRPGAANYLGADLLRDRPSGAPGRSIIDLVNTQPGWLLEANGVLHARGSEYQVQYVIDGIPFRDNRSPAFAQSLGVDAFESMTVRTAGYPAEYGNKLGGVIEVNTIRDPRPGFHGAGALQAGGFATFSGSFLGRYVAGRTSIGASGDGFRTNRYLDPPVLENDSNHGAGGGAAAYVERDWDDRNRTRVTVERRQTSFQVPNEALQEQAGQRQDRSADETLAYAIQEHVFSPSAFGGIRFMVRDTSTDLQSNAASTPIRPTQQRGFREAYVNGTLSVHRGIHELKGGVEATFASLDEHFASTIVAYQLNGVRIFDRDVPPDFNFADRGTDREQAAFLQDQLRIGPFTASVGLRYDRYRLAVAEDAVSPRASASWFIAPANLVLHGSYDRTFQTPAVENILLASSNLVRSLGGEGQSLPLLSSRGHFYEAGFSRTFRDRLRIDGNAFFRTASNLADDDLLLNTAVSFPIAFSHGTVKGFEAKADVPRWGNWSGSISYSLSSGTGQLPIAGGLFLGDEAEALLESHDRFPITQDQRHTVRGRVRYQVAPRAWIAGAVRYDSGLPVEIDGSPDLDFLIQQYGAAIVDRVDFARGRVRPSASIDAAVGVDLLNRGHKAIRLQADAFNLAGRLNVINFAGLLSGTAVGPPRTAAVRMLIQF